MLGRISYLRAYGFLLAFFKKAERKEHPLLPRVRTSSKATLVSLIDRDRR